MSCPCIGTVRALATFASTLSILLIHAAGGASGARADSAKRAHMPSAVLLATGGAPSGGEALDSVIHASLEELALVRVTARPGMDLGALQLALDCIAETTQCLRAVTTQTSTQILIAPTVQRTPSELILTLLRFDARGDGDTRRVLRRFPGKTLGSAALDAVPDMLRELFGLPAKPKTPPVAEVPAPAKAAPVSTQPTAPLPLPEGPMEPEAPRPTPVGPLVLAGAGVLVIGGGVVAGLMMLATQDEYNKHAPDTSTEVPNALDTKSTGKTEETVANVLFVVGGAAVVAGGIWLIVELNRPRPQYETLTSLRPVLGPHQLGLVLTHRGGWL
jgi:hypothetical protein